MLTEKQLLEIKEHLENAQNPLFYFDNDVDGLISFILLTRAIGRGKGVNVKGHLDKSYFRKINELNPDYVFILDKPAIDKDFLELVEERNIPIVLIDHHPQEPIEMEGIFYYNSQPSGEPTSYIAQKIFNKGEDMWLSLVGCIGDVHKPSFSKDVEKQFPEVYDDNLPAFEAMYKTEIGKIARMLNFGLKDTTTNVLSLIRLLRNVHSPLELLMDDGKTRNLHKKFNSLQKVLEKNIEKAKKNISKDILYYEYSGATSMSSEISNSLMFLYPEKLIVVGFRDVSFVNISLRGKGAKDLAEKIVENIEGGRGGGHELASGARIPIEGLEKFKELLKEFSR